ncbi:MAG: hypothetical protein FJW37_14145 [Acidobacteria bacterium]|nr:hypothetical protein [Acidobacteriota bacterium]
MLRISRLVFVLALASSAPLFAAFTFKITAINLTGVDVYDIHVLISGTGGTIHNLMPIMPAAQAISSPNGNDIDAAWDAALPNFGVWMAKFDVNHSELRIEAAHWTDDKHRKVADIPVNLVQLQQVPEPGTWLFGASALAAGMLMRKFRK